MNTHTDDVRGAQRNSATMTKFLLWTFGLTWLVWIPVAVLQPSRDSWLVPVVITGAFMPSIMGVVFGGIVAPKEERTSFWMRLLQPQRIPGRFWLFLIFMAPSMNLIGHLVARALGGPAFELDPRNFAGIGAILGFLVFTMIGGPLAEELGWRGVLLPELLQRHAALKATMILGVIWVVWHLPLFWIKGTTQAAQGLFTLHGVQWIVEVLALSVIVTWLFLRTGWSTLGAVMIHFMDNLAFSTLAGADYERDPVASLVVTTLYVMVAMVILWRTAGLKS